MENEFRLGLVAEIKDEEGYHSRPVESKDWKYLFDFFGEKGSVVLFDWKSVGRDFNISKYVTGSGNSLEVVKEVEDIRNLCDIVYIGQLGKIRERKNQFLDFLDVLESFSGRVVNPVKTIKSNLSKQYLLELQKQGVSVIPTMGVSRGCSLEDLKNLSFPNYGKSIDDLVLKPKFFGEQGGAVIRLSEIKNEEEFRKYLDVSGEVIAQPLISDIYTKGENSFVFVGRKFSHGLNKITGNFKINLCGSSRYTPRNPTGIEMDLCQRVFDVWPTDFDYARIDIIPSDEPLVGEVEMVNPAGYLSEINAFEKYSSNLNKRLNDIYKIK